MQTTFTIDEIRNYLVSCDSFGDAVHFLSAAKIIESNNSEDTNDEMESEEPLQQCDLYNYVTDELPENNFIFIGVDGYEYKFDCNKYIDLEKTALHTHDDFLISNIIGGYKKHLINMIDNKLVTLVED